MPLIVPFLPRGRLASNTIYMYMYKSNQLIIIKFITSQSAKDSAAGQNINVGLVREEELRTPCSPQAVYPSDGTSSLPLSHNYYPFLQMTGHKGHVVTVPNGSTDGGASHVQNQDALHPMRAGIKGAAPQGNTRENDELREENRQLEEKVSELGQKLKESESNVRKMVSKCERLQREASGDKVPQDNFDGGESLMDQVDELRTEGWEKDDKIKELEKELAYNVERSRTLTMIRDHSTNQSRIIMTLKDQIKALEVNTALEHSCVQVVMHMYAAMSSF